MEPQRQSLKTTLPLCLGRYHISEEFGFLLPNPLKELPEYYQPWVEIANKLPYLIERHQLRARVNQMPLLSCSLLHGHHQLRLAHLVLSAVTMGYVWQEGERQPAEPPLCACAVWKSSSSFPAQRILLHSTSGCSWEAAQQVLPRNLAVPMVGVSGSLGLPPILAHSGLVLANWTKKDPKGPLEISNLETIVSLPGGESLRGFVLVTVLVEKAAVPGIKALTQATNAILQPNEDTLLKALQRLRLSIQDITRTLGQMHDYVDPDIFYAVIRIFLSGCQRQHLFSVRNQEQRVPRSRVSLADGTLLPREGDLGATATSLGITSVLKDQRHHYYIIKICKNKHLLEAVVCFIFLLHKCFHLKIYHVLIN
ncbi:indoleamine 2,3-dioxygenase 2 isoform X4 [Fukomys damarensis]|uniref:indoleamine 2,3-dioxygenase 2 isoform X4 n=1 Tax=Fukomys damarensis TaxID=885580 RepID=UPI00053F5B2B|nr:indoleamine 2,3-dioxygenase 2 isoform X4 [Fukomys damarensis]